MARYFFDAFDGKKVMRDEVGIELDNVERVRTEAVDALPDIARDELPDDESVFAVQARDEQGRIVFTATLTFKGEWNPPPR